MGDDLSVVNAARVSFGKKREALGYTGISDGVMCPVLHDTDKRLIRYLAKHKHMSPFGHCFASFHVKAPIFVARQLVKHKFLRWNEISRRYVDDEPEFYVPDQWRGRADDKKQGSDGIVDIEEFVDCLTGKVTEPQVYPMKDMAYEPEYENWTLGDTLHDTMNSVMHVYFSLLSAGVAPEQARMVLPQSTMTEWYWSGSLDAFIDMCNLRCKDDTQYETRLVADYIRSELIKLFPVSVESLVNYWSGSLDTFIDT